MIAKLVLRGALDTNCYFLADATTGRGLLIDPGAQGDRVVELCRQKGWIVEKILLTHGHFDHFGGAETVRAAFGCPVLIHESGAALLADPALNLSGILDEPFTLQNPQLLREGDEIAPEGLPELTLRVIHTPGHTCDSCVFYWAQGGAAFVGDTIFKGSYGAYHYPTGDLRAELKSIREKILTLPPDTVLLSGHSEQTTVAAEARYY